MRACIKSRARAGCGGACGAATVPAEYGGVKWGQWGRALLTTNTAVHACPNSKLQLRMRIISAYLQARSLGLRRVKGPRVRGWCGNRGVLMRVPASAGLLVPARAGVLQSAGGSLWPVPGRRLETSVRI